MNKVLIGVPSGSSVPIAFMSSYTKAIKMEGDDDYLFYNHRGTNTVTARNQCVYEMLIKDYTHLFFMDSDMVFPDGTLERLLAHDVDIVGGFYVRKRSGFLPNAFQLGERPNGKYITEWVTEYKEVEGIGTGCLLIKREVFKKIKCPWFEYKWNGEPNGKMVTEDLVFCDKAKESGFKVYCDGTIHCGHVGSMVIWPMQKPMKIKVEPI